MGSRRMTAMLGAVLAASIFGTAAAAQTSKLDARILARRSASPSGGYGVSGAGATAAGPQVPVLIRVQPGTPIESLRAAFPTATFGTQAGDVITARADDAGLDAMALDARVRTIHAGVVAHPSMDLVRSSSTSGGLALGTIYGSAATDLAGVTGAGVIVGVVDTGIDYTHKDFINDSPNTSRILFIWDQTISSHTGGPFPSGYTYGAEYSNAQLTSKIQGGAVTINTKDTDGHGTHVASIAAGDGTGTNGTIAAGTFKGMAPSADIIFVRTSFNTADVVDGVAYIVAKAAAAGKPAVINLSLGTQFGPHDGTDTFEAGIAALAANTPVVVAMGNDGASGVNPHASASVPSGSASFTVSSTTSKGDVDVEFWHSAADGYTVTVTLGGVSGSVSATSGANTITTLGTNNVEIYNATNSGHPLGDKQVYVYVYKHSGSGITGTTINVNFTKTTSGGNGRIDGWVDPAGELVSFTTQVDGTMTLGEPAAAANVFGVASYAGKQYWNSIDGNTYNFTSQNVLGNLSYFSSQGPTRDGRQQPDVTAPGDVIAAALSSDPSANPGNALILTDAKHRILRGTSMAAPVVTGILAGRLQYGTTRTVAQLRAILRAQARSDGATGSLPNYAWGYGKVSSSPQPVSPPTGLTATTLGPSSVTWNWSTVVGADSYSLYYATNPTIRFAAGVQPPYIHTNLAANTTTGALIKGNGGGVDGPGAFVSTATLANPPLALPSTIPHVDSVTVSWTPCPAAPVASSCWGYTVTATTAPNGSGTVFSATTLNRADASLDVTGLQPLTTYYFRQATLNFYGAPTATGPVSGQTLTDLLAPISPQLSGASTTSIRFDWNGGGNVSGITYVADASTSAVFSGVVLSSATKNLYAIFTGMATNASYYFRVQAQGGPYLTPGTPYATLAAEPGVSTAPFSGVSQTGFTVAWSTGGNSANTLYKAEVSAAPDFSAIAASSSTRNLNASFTGLTPNTLYYARAQAISQGGVTSAYTTFGSTPTFVFDPTLPGQPFSTVTSGGFTFSFNNGGNAAGTTYAVRVSTDPLFGLLAANVNTTALSATFTGLSSNRLYYAAVAALNLSGTPTAYTGAVSTGTLALAPAAASPAVSTHTTAALGAAWTTSTLGPGTNFLLQASLTPGFGVIAGSSTTLNAFATVSGLTANTSYYLRVRALSLNPPQPDSAWTSLGSASTLANAPTAAATPFPLIGVASMTVAWTALPLAPPAAACEGYLAELSLSPAFNPVLRSSVVAPGATTANFSGLAYATLYYARVASLDQEGNPNYFTIGSTKTITPGLSSGTVGGSGLVLNLPSFFPIAPAVSAQIDPGTFPPGTVVTMLSGVTLDLANPQSSVAKLVALGTAVGVDISAGGLQPLKPVRLTMSYDPLLLPPGADARRLLIARFDDASGLWTLVPSAVDTAAHQIVATLDHFSSYSPFFATAGAGLSDGVVFPQPWEAGDSGGAYGAQTLTFANYPAGTKVRLMSLTGEQIWEGVAGANGVLTWDGRNKSGRSVASGTYYAIIEAGGSRKVRRVVVIR